MKKIHRLLALFMLCGLFAVSTLLFLLTQGEHAQLPLGGTYDSIAIEGDYSLDQDIWQPLTPETNFNVEDYHTLTVRGHFTKDIPKNQQLMMRITNLKVSLLVNGTPTYSFGQPEQNHKLTHSGGNVWHNFTSQGITKEDDIILTLSNDYLEVYPEAFDTFLENLKVGSVEGLYRAQTKALWHNLYLGLMILFCGMMQLLIVIPLSIFSRTYMTRGYLYVGLAIVSGLWFSLLFDVVSLYIPYPAFINALELLSMYATGLFICLYFTNYLTEKRLLAGLLASTLSAFMILCYALFQLFGVMDLYDTPPFGSFIALGSVLVCALGVLLERRAHPKDKILQYLLLSTTPLLFSCIMVTGFYWLRLVNTTIFITIGYLIFSICQTCLLVYQYNKAVDEAKQAQILKDQLTQQRISTMVSQIQPHFLYNSLLAIEQLCDEDPKQAAIAVSAFTHYLRGNMDALDSKSLVAFDRELEHIRHYISLEKMRFGARLQMVYVIETNAFFLPTLTLQPLVENAVRYGITKRPEGGTITLGVKEDQQSIIITIQDNGVGFDPTEEIKDSRSHIGLANTKMRLEGLCHGKLEIESNLNIGTCLTITLPKERVTHANINS